MSQNPSRGNESRESSQYRRTARSGSFNQQRGGGKGGGGGGAGSAPPPSNPSLSSNRSFNKKYSNVQGGQSRASGPSVSSEAAAPSAARTVENGAHQQPPLHGMSDVPITSSGTPQTSSTVKPADGPAQKIPRVVPRSPSSNISAINSDSAASSTPSKGDASKSFPLQFGSISPGFMNGMQIPARTSSAPPNLDEQKRDQARHDSSRAVPSLPIPSSSKQPVPRKDAGSIEQANTSDSYPSSKSKRDAQIPTHPPASQTQKPSVLPIPGIPQMPFHQPQIPVQFGGPNPQLQSQAMSATSLPMPMPMPLSIGNASVQQPVFVSGLQPHPMQTQGIMHQGQNLNFSSQMGPQLPPQLSNMGISMAPQFPQQQAGKFGGPRKTVKITHPETHEELRLDGSPAARSHPNITPQSQPIPSFQPGHPMSYYHNSYNASSIYFASPLNNTQIPPTQPPRYYNQVTVKPAVSSQGEKDPSFSAGSPPVGKGEVPKPSTSRREESASPEKDLETSSHNSLQQPKPVLGPKPTLPPVMNTSSAAGVGSISTGSQLSASLSSTSASIEFSASVSAGEEGTRRETVDGPESSKDEENKLNENSLIQDQVLSSSSQSAGSDIMEPKTTVLESTTELPLRTIVSTPDVAAENINFSKEGGCHATSKDSGLSIKENKRLDPEISGLQEEKVKLPEAFRKGSDSFETSVVSPSLDSSETVDQTEDSSLLKETNTKESAQRELEESGVCSAVDVSQVDNVETSSSFQDGGNLETRTSDTDLSLLEHKTVSVDSPSRSDTIIAKVDSVKNSASSGQESALKLIPSSGATFKCEDEVTEELGSSFVPSSPVMEKSLSETTVLKSTASRAKTRRRESLKKANAAGAISDLYMAYKGPEEKKENVITAESVEYSLSSGMEQLSVDVSQEDLANDKAGQSKSEPEDWEDAADISTAGLETSENSKQDGDGEDGNKMRKKYSRDFLLTVANQCTDLPGGFEITSDIAEVLMVPSINVSRETYPNPGRGDRQIGGSRSDRRGSGMGGEDKWSKVPGPLGPGRDMRLDIGYAGNMMGFRPGQGGNFGVLKNPRVQTPVQYAGGILSGPVQSPGFQGGIQRNGADSDRWQRGSAFQKGLMPSPQTPLQVMHKAEKKYEVGKVTDEEEAKQRLLKAILNKLTPQNFEKLFQQVKEVNIDNDVTLNGVISQIFDKALMEPTFCEMYADFCSHLAAVLPELSVDKEKITFKRLLLNKCQEEFERGEREEEEAKKTDEEGEAKLSEEEREEKRLKARRRMLGNIRLIGELYKKKMLTEKIMHACIRKLLGENQNPDEEDVEALCKLMSTIGEMIDHSKAKEHMDAYFDNMAILSNNMKLSSRVRFMLKDSIDLRRNKWQQRRKVEGPKKIEEVHRDAAQERQAQASRLARAPSVGGSVRRGQPVDFAPRGSSMLSSPGSQMGGFRSTSQQARGVGTQDVRLEDRHSFENRTLSVPPSQRHLTDDSITLGPQGGLGRGMSFRGQSSGPSIPLADIPSPGDSRRMAPGLNGYSSMPERPSYSSREDLMPRYVPERFVNTSVYDQSRAQEQGASYANRDRSFDASLPASPPKRGGGMAHTRGASLEKVWPEERLRDKSMAAIKEFYSAKDENEVILCIKDLNAPSFYPSMISIWVTDSFERKDMERDLLAKLLVNLAKSREGMINQDQLIKGFESVLVTLEDAVNDAPKAAEFLGRIFARVILDNVLPLSEISRLIYEGGEEGRLVEVGLAAEVLGSILEIIKSEKGDSVLNDICRSSNLRLENFRPPGSNRQLKLDRFM